MSDDDDYELPEDDLLIKRAAPRAEKENKPAKKPSRPPLTQRVVERAQPEANEYTVYHKTMSGFGMRVRPSGKKSFVLVCKKRGQKGSNRITIGDAGAMPLEEAEEHAYKALQNIREYGDPDGNVYYGKKWTLRTLFDEYITDHGKSLCDSWRKQSEQIFHQYIEPEFGNTLVSNISRGDFVRCIKVNNTVPTQRHVRCVLSSMYTWAVNLEYVTENIVRDIKIGKVKSRDRFLTDVEIAAVYSSSYKLGFPFGEYGRFLMMSGQRRSEAANMTWSEVDFEQKIWTLPAERSKNRHKHIIPLTDAMIELLTALPRTSKYVFDSPYNEGSPINSFSKMNYLWRKNTWVKEWRLHDLRRTLASGMAEIGVAPHIIEAVLNHRTGVVSGIAAVYNRYKYEKEKREALELWQAHLTKVVEQHKDFVPKSIEDEVEL